MVISDILDPERVMFGVDAGSKKKVLEKMSELLASAEEVPDTRSVFDNLCARERLGSTGLGHGVAIPHCRMPTLKRAVGAMLKTNRAVDFDSPDGQPV
ncbi:MAG: PTS sugar transporter subunit IIA, partial [Gammaproteobacteria bacterium]